MNASSCSVKTLAGVLVVLLLLQVVIMMLLDEYGNCALLDCKTTVNNSVRQVRRQREHHPRLFYWTAASPQSEELLTPGAFIHVITLFFGFASGGWVQPEGAAPDGGGAGAAKQRLQSMPSDYAQGLRLYISI
ncbi:hypothetical protein AgCh_010999 [Apium graveolens]